MSDLFNPESEFMIKAGKIADLAILSVLWTLCSLTIVGIGPATTALYYAVVKSVRRDRGGIFQEFWSGIKKSWKPSLPAGLVVLLFTVSIYKIDLPSLILCISGEADWNLLTGILAFVKLLLGVGMFLYAFPIISRYEVGMVKSLAYAAFMTLRKFPMSLLFGLLLILMVVLCAWHVAFLFILPGLFMLLWSFQMENILHQLMQDDEKVEDQSKDQWYLE